VNVGIREALQGIFLLLDRRIEAQPVENPRDDDVVGDTGLGEFAVAVDAELVDARIRYAAR
jgi:hypothetical protein